MFCKKCGSDMPDHATFCQNCGTAVTPQYDAPTPVVDPGAAPGKNSVTLGIISLVIALLCSWSNLGFAGIVCGIVGIVQGSSGLKKSKAAGFENKNAKTGLTLSIIGTVLGVIVTVVVFIISFAVGFAAGLSGY